MSYSVSYDEKLDCVMVAVTGVLDLELLKSVAESVGKITTKHGCRRVLNNLSNAKVPDKALEIYKMPAKANQMGVGAECRRALVVGDRASEFYFMETVFVNQGHQVKMFATVDEAKAWLLKE